MNSRKLFGVWVSSDGANVNSVTMCLGRQLVQRCLDHRIALFAFHLLKAGINRCETNEFNNITTTRMQCHCNIVGATGQR